ncbi:MAG: DHH family phosphoesterase [Ruminococcus sp.]|jgi:phosphoesterase RecJ-like protein
MKKIEEILQGVKTAAIAGHVNPDGDCVGSCMALYHYLGDNDKEIHADVYLEEMRPVFGHLKLLDEVKKEAQAQKIYDLLILLDVSSPDRIGVAGEYYKTAKKTVCIDHHITNPGLGDINHIVPEASSTSEVLFDLMEKEKISADTASALYTGIIHDCGVFQYSNTSSKTMEAAGWLMDQGIPFTKIIEDSFYKKSYNQNRMMGYILLNSRLYLEGRCIGACASRESMEQFQVEARDLDGIINQMRLTEDVEAAVFLYAVGENRWKVSMRSNGKVDVSAIALSFGGGGHFMAAGCTLEGEQEKIMEKIVEAVKQQLGVKKV